MDKRTGSASQWRFCLTFFRILILLQPKSKPEMNKHMKNIIVITGASSGFGALTARALAKAGHTVYASMRETRGRNAPQVEEAKKFAKDNDVDLRAIELDVSSQDLVTQPSRRSLPRTVASTWSFTTPDTWFLVRPKRSRPNNSLSCMTSTS